MSQTDCGTIREHLPDFAAGRLAAEAVAAVESHLPGCAECRAELEASDLEWKHVGKAVNGRSLTFFKAKVQTVSA